MKKLVQVVIIIQFSLMLTHCATSTDALYVEYAACREQTLIPKVNPNGIVQVHADGSVVMVYPTGACPDELDKWEKSSVLREKRRRDREAYNAAVSSCGSKAVLVCSGRGTSKCISRQGELNPWCKCECVSRHAVNRMLGGRYFNQTHKFVPTDRLQFRAAGCEKKNF